MLAAGLCELETAIVPELGLQNNPELDSEAEGGDTATTAEQGTNVEPWFEQGGFGLRADGRRRPDDGSGAGLDDFDHDDDSDDDVDDDFGDDDGDLDDDFDGLEGDEEL